MILSPTPMRSFPTLLLLSLVLCSPSEARHGRNLLHSHTATLANTPFHLSCPVGNGQRSVPQPLDASAEAALTVAEVQRQADSLRPWEGKGANSAPAMRVAIVHYAKLTARRTRMSKALEGVGISQEKVMWLDMFDRSTLTSEKSQALFGSSDYAQLQVSRQLASDANIWSQYSLYLEMVKRRWPLLLVLEDDASADRLTPEVLSKHLAESARCAGTKQALDVLHLGDVDSAYILTLSGAEKLLHQFVKIKGGRDGRTEAVEVPYLHSGGNDFTFAFMESGAGDAIMQRAGCEPIHGFSVTNSLLSNTEHSSHLNELIQLPSSLVSRVDHCPELTPGMMSNGFR